MTVLPTFEDLKHEIRHIRNEMTTTADDRILDLIEAILNRLQFLDLEK